VKPAHILSLYTRADVAKSTSATLSKGGGYTDGVVPLPVSWLLKISL